MTQGPASSARERLRAEDGAGVITSIFGVMVFLSFVLFVVQVVLYMFTASIVQTAALDGATHGATQGDAVRAAQERADGVLGAMADDATVSGAVAADASGQVLRVTVRVRPPSSLVRGLGVDAIERSAVARIEQ